MKLLLAIDDSYYSELALREVASRPWPDQTTVRVLSVAFFLGAAVPGPPVGGDTTRGLGTFAARTQLLETTNQLVQRAAELIARDDVKVETLVREGDPGTEIVQEAETWPADLIVVGSHGRQGLKRALLGSVAHYVASHAPCSIEIARPRSAS